MNYHAIKQAIYYINLAKTCTDIPEKQRLENCADYYIEQLRVIELLEVNKEVE